MRLFKISETHQYRQLGGGGGGGGGRSQRGAQGSFVAEPEMGEWLDYLNSHLDKESMNDS